jgi:ribosomal protein S18 acetylase RimI-like enzyme
MASLKFLIDTNVVIGLEDNHVVKEGFARFLAKCHEHGGRVFVHDASRMDVSRDTDNNRRRITLSKLSKFERLHRISLPPTDQLEGEFGLIRKTNDEIDVELLFALRRNAIDFLVTEDQALIRRAYKADLGRRVFNVDEAESWLRNTFEQSAIALPNIVEQKVYQLDFSDPLFDSIGKDYAGFDAWLEKCSSEHRSCWTVSVNGGLAALLIYKEEDHATARTKVKGTKIFKICTFKISDVFRGEKFGEQLLKQCLWHAQKNGFDVVYLTAYPKQEALIFLLHQFGFEDTGTQENDEHIFEKTMEQRRLDNSANAGPLEFHRKFYPRFLDSPPIGKYCVPIWPRWHQRLFPELKGAAVATLARSATPSARSERPGNTIRKVYLCRAKAGSMKAGDILLFYVTKNETTPLSQSITTLGIVERVRETREYSELLRLTGKRSVFTEFELQQMMDRNDTPVKVIDFLLAGHMQQGVSLQQAVELGVLRSWPQTICRVGECGYTALKGVMRLGWERALRQHAMRDGQRALSGHSRTGTSR